MVKALAHEAIYDTVARVLDPLPRGALLDIPAGEGALAARLIGLGFGVRCCDLYPEIFGLPEVEIKRGDLSGALPYAAERFNYIVCVEGLEHIENPYQAVREFQRLLRPGGHLVVSVPNILNIEERLKWLLYGYTSHFKPLSRAQLERMGDEFSGIEEVALHINPIGYSELRYMLEKYGFTILGTHLDKPKNNMWAYRPLAGLIRLLDRRLSARKQTERWTAELHSDEVLLGGNALILHATKHAG